MALRAKGRETAGCIRAPLIEGLLDRVREALVLRQAPLLKPGGVVAPPETGDSTSGKKRQPGG
jgi:hypothetical protein